MSAGAAPFGLIAGRALLPLMAMEFLVVLVFERERA
jgi:hypothetical protein